MILEMKASDYDLYMAGFHEGQQDVKNESLRGSTVIIQELGIMDGTDEAKWLAIGYYDATTGLLPMNQRPELQLEF